MWTTWVSASSWVRKLCTWAGNERKDALLPMNPWMYTTRSVRFRPWLVSLIDGGTRECVDNVQGSWASAHSPVASPPDPSTSRPGALGGDRGPPATSTAGEVETPSGASGVGGKAMTSQVAGRPAFFPAFS